MHLEELVAIIIDILVPFIELAGAWIIVWGVVRAFVHHLRSSFSGNPECVGNLRLQLVQTLVVGLEFQLAADVLRTAHVPTWKDLGNLAALIALRTVLNYLLEREAHHLGSHQVPAHLGTCDASAEPSTDEAHA